MENKDRGFNVLWILLALLKGKMIKYSDSESVSESVSDFYQICIENLHVYQA